MQTCSTSKAWQLSGAEAASAAAHVFPVQLYDAWSVSLIMLADLFGAASEVTT